MKRPSRTITLALGHACCTGTLCLHGEKLPLARALRRIRGGGHALILRAAPRGAELGALVAGGHAEGFGEVILATSGLDQWDASAIQESGVDAVRVTLFSHVPAVHDRLAGRENALVGSLVTMRALAKFGIPIELEAPLLSPQLSDPSALLDLALRAVRLRALRYYIHAGAVPRAVAAPRLEEIGDALAEAVRRAVSAGVTVRFESPQGIPPCALADHEDALPFFVFPRSAGRPGHELQSACEPCALRTECGGPTVGYAAAHGGRGLRPFESRPKALGEDDRSRRPRWGPREREAARHVRFVVLRPTVHCNQDCLFCSANESSGNAFSDPKTMLKAIARMAQRGVQRISFSGGEPTLSPRLADYISAAKRCGVPEIEIVTNGVLLDREAKVRRLVDAGLTHAFVSLHAHDEELSSTLTQKEGDHARTLEAIDRMLDAGVLVVVNHVITARNQTFLPTFVETLHARFSGRVLISFAFVTPQYKALQYTDLWPRLSETRPYLMHALSRAMELGQPAVVGSRQGVPPCMLGRFAPWSDVFDLAAEAASEDTPQKTRGESCERCRYGAICNGVWIPYAQRFGTDELIAVEGTPFDDEELRTIRAHHRPPPWGVPMSFEDACELVRDREAESRPLPELPRAKVTLAVHRPRPQRALRALVVGSGRRAQVLAEATSRLERLAITAVASPHAPESKVWGSIPTFRDVSEALDEIRPEAAIVASATETHGAMVRACLEAGVPVLLEKPVTRTLEEARALEELVGPRAWISCANQELFAPGLDGLAEGSGSLSLTFRARADASDSPRAWGRRPLAETLHHVLSLAVRARGSVTGVERAHFEGASRPERLRAILAHERGEVDLRLDFSATSDELSLLGEGFEWRRAGRDVSRDGVPIARDGNDIERMLRAFGAAITAQAQPPAPLAEGVAILDAVERLLDALEEAGAPLRRANAPKHVVSPRYRGR